MIPDQQLEAFLLKRMQAKTYWQVVSARQQEDLHLPRVVVSVSATQDPVLAQAAVFPCAVSVQIIADAREAADISAVSAIVETELFQAAVPYSVSTQRQVVLATGNLVVSGTGVPAADGVYEPDGESGGKARFTLEGGTTDEDSFSWDDLISGFWKLFNNSTFVIGSTEDVATPDLVEGDWLDGTTSEPVPAASVTPETETQTITETSETTGDENIAIFGTTLGDSSQQQADDRIEKTVSATIYARLKGI
jgi:hypothetical protein